MHVWLSASLSVDNLPVAQNQAPRRHSKPSAPPHHPTALPLRPRPERRSGGVGSAALPRGADATVAAVERRIEFVTRMPLAGQESFQITQSSAGLDSGDHFDYL